MNPAYFCKHENRRADVLEHDTLNGIDYLEVLDKEAPPGSPRQQTLLVHCLSIFIPLLLFKGLLVPMNYFIFVSWLVLVFTGIF